MSNSATISAIPKLRFRQFESEGDWSYENGDQLFDSISDKNHNSDLPILAITQDQGAIPRDQIDYHVSVSEKGVENYKVVQIGDFIISLRSFQGGIEYSNYHGLCSPAYIILRREKDGSDSFYKYYFKSRKFIQDLNKNLEGIRDGKMVSYKQFSEILIPNPSPAEQQKIADCLSSLDELIQAETERLEALQAHKKGLMQQLFPAEGETIPKLRFPEFQESGEWVEKELGEVAEIKTGNTPKTKDEDNYGGEFMFVTPGDIGINRYVEKSKITLSNKGFDKARKIKANSILFVCIGSTIGKVAQIKKECSMNQQINSLTPFEENLSDFLYSVLEHNGDRISGLAGKQAVPIINKSLFSSIKFMFPENLEEQVKISDIFSSIDSEIFSKSEKIESLKSHKKGLLQQLFPQLD